MPGNNPPHKSHDPYPMSSPQAAQLAASVHNDDSAASNQGGGDIWTHMDTVVTTTNTTTTTSHSRADGAASGQDEENDHAASASLTASSSRRRKQKLGTDVDDIYAEDPIATARQQEDEFLERPLWESRYASAGPWQRQVIRVQRVAHNIYHRLYGDDLPISEMLRTLCLASTLFFMIGGYWTLRSLKDPVLTALCGVAVIPKAKMLSVVVVLAVVSVYNAFLDSDIPRHRLFYLFGTFYLALFTVISMLLLHPTLGLPNQQASPWRLLGWISYCSIESFGSVMVSLFWSFCNSNFDLKQAKASYGVMVATAQVGSILGPTLVNAVADRWGVAHCYLMGASCMLWLQLTMSLYIKLYGTAERNATTTTTTKKEEPQKAASDGTTTTTAPPAKKKAGILEGLELFIRYNYVKGIFAISCLFMVEVTIVDFTMKVLARDYFATEYPCHLGESCWDASPAAAHGMSTAATAAFTKFMGFFGQATNTLSFLMSLLGTSAIIRYLGLRWTLLLFPSLCLAVICTVRLHPTLYVVFGAMIALKAASYSLNNPTKEMLYQPTSPAVRYKAKSWIDIFGARGSKAMGSVVTNAFSDNTANLVANGSLVGMAVASFLIWNARFMGKLFEEYTTSGYIVGQDDDSLSPDALEAKNVNMASHQNDQDDTSCAIPEEDDDEGGGGDGGDDEEKGQKSVGDDASKEKPQVTMV